MQFMNKVLVGQSKENLDREHGGSIWFWAVESVVESWVTALAGYGIYLFRTL